MSKIDELLAKLDMTEDSPEQYGWLLSTIREHKACCPADLAFRLRDEAVKEDSDLWAKACWYVQQWIGFHKIEVWDTPSFDALMNAEHEILTKEAIVWIIAALIAAVLIAKQ